MVGTLARLQLRLWTRGLKRNTGALIATIVAGLYGLGLLAGITYLAVEATGQPVGVRLDVLVTAFGMIGVLRLFALFVTGQEQSLDPARFALLPLRARQLLPGLLVAAFCTIGPWFLIALVVDSALMFRDHLALMLLVAVCGVLGLVLSTLTCRVMVLVLSRFLQARRYRDIAGVVVMVLLTGSGVILQGVVQKLETVGLARLGGFARVLGWTPFGWPWAVVDDLHRGRWLLAAVRLVLCLALGVLLWRAWALLLDRQLTSPLEAGGGSGAVRTGTLADRISPRTPAGAVAARTLRYYRRDPRHVLSLVVMAMMPLIMVAPTMMGTGTQGLGQFGRGALALAAFVGMMMGSTVVAQDISLDGSALWQQITAGVSGRADRWGRVYAFGLVALPIMLVIDVALALATHQGVRTLALWGVSLGTLGVSAAVGTVSGSLLQTPSPPPGSSPFAKGSSGGPVAVLVVFGGLFASGVLALPFVVSGWMVWYHPVMGWVPLVVALVLVPLLLWLACRIGGSRLDHTWPEVLKRVTYEK